MGLTEWLRKGWKEAAILALLAAFLIELVVNVFGGRTVWHRLGALEHSVQQLEHERELQELRTRSEFEQLRQKAQSQEQVIEKVEQRVEKKGVPAK